MVGPQIHRSDHFPLFEDAFREKHLVAADASAFELRPGCKIRSRHASPRVPREEVSPRVVQGARDDVRFCPEHREVFTRHIAVVEEQGRRHRLREDFGLRLEILFQCLLIAAEIVADHRRGGDQQRGHGRGEHDEQQPCANRMTCQHRGAAAGLRPYARGVGLES
jgi:hypothetical protein